MTPRTQKVTSALNVWFVIGAQG